MTYEMTARKKVITRRIELMKAEGVEFVCNANIGRDAEGIYFAVDFAWISDQVVCLCSLISKKRPEIESLFCWKKVKYFKNKIGGHL